MKKITLMKTFLTSTLTVLFLSGCGGSDSNFDTSGDNDNDDDTTVSTFNGTWSEGCFYDNNTLESDFISVTINDASSTVSKEFYGSIDCSGSSIRSETVSYNYTYQGDISLSNCYNGQNVDIIPQFPITINSTSYTEAEHAALSSAKQSTLPLATSYDLLCTDQFGTVLYTGDETTGNGTTSTLRPTEADITNGLSKL